jgi:ATP-dependent Clp protease adaptor protein ClpS
MTGRGEVYVVFATLNLSITLKHFMTQVTYTAPQHPLASFEASVTVAGNNPRKDHGDLLLLEPKTRTVRPPLFKVMMLNDDYTPMDFVVEVLKTIFHQPHEEAVSVMLNIHHQGAGLCGIYTRDVAETKIEMVENLAREQEYPLQCRLERE